MNDGRSRAEARATYRIAAPRMLGLLVILSLAACQERMANQPRYKPFRQSVLDSQQTSGFMPVPNTIYRGELEQAALSPDWPKEGLQQGYPFTISDADLARGRERYEIYCLPCHGPKGRADGEVVKRGFYKPPDYREAGLVDKPPAYLVEVISRGRGQMASYASQVQDVRDRWRIAAYIKVLQGETTP